MMGTEQDFHKARASVFKRATRSRQTLGRTGANAFFRFAI
jgi:hypothetical protein